MESLMKTMKFTALIAALLVLPQAHPTVPARAERQVAITIDDLPYTDGPCDLQQVLSITEKLLTPIRMLKVPVVGFVIGEQCQELATKQRHAILKVWLDAGGELGNHTWTHPNLNEVSPEAYEVEILRTDKYLHRLLDPVTIRYFRAPYLQDGENAESKARLQSFLLQHGYKEAPVTLNNNDWVFADAYSHALKANNTSQAKEIRDAYIPYMQSIVEFFEKRSMQVFGRECPQVLLIHASRLNAEMMPALLAMFQARGYSFVSLQKAMSDSAYRLRMRTQEVKGCPGSIAGVYPRERRSSWSPTNRPGSPSLQKQQPSSAALKSSQP
jgi:peptidoglycan/xylan/chitin deacetylase (PgdA/CDA1 family)